MLLCGPSILSHELSAVNIILPGLAACGCWVAGGQAGGAQYGAEQVPVWLSAGRAECLQVRSGSGVQTGGAGLRAWGLGCTWCLDTSNGIGWPLSRSDIHVLGFQASLGSSAGSTRWAPGPAGDLSPALGALLLICGPSGSAVTSGRSGGARDLLKGSSPFPVRPFEARAFSVVIC